MIFSLILCMLIGSIHSDMNNPHTFYHLECTTGAKLVVKKFIKAVPNETLGDILEREIPPSCRICGVFTAEDKATHSSELDLTMTTQALNEFGVKRISVKVAAIESESASDSETNNRPSPRPSALEMLMQESRKSVLPERRTENNSKDRMFNKVLDLLSSLNVGFQATTVNDTGRKLISTITKVLWYLDPHHQKFAARGLSMPKALGGFTGFNDWKSTHKKMPRVEATELKYHMDITSELLMYPCMVASSKEPLRNILEEMVEVMEAYYKFLLTQQDISNRNHRSPEPVRSHDDNWSFRLIEGNHSAEASEEYQALSAMLQAAKLYEPCSLLDISPSDKSHRRRWLSKIQLPFPIMLYTYRHGNYIGNLVFAWRIPAEVRERSDELNIAAVQAVSKLLPKYSTREMRRDFLMKYSKVANAKPAVLRSMYRYLTGDESANYNAADDAVQSRLLDVLLQSDDTELVYDLRQNNGRPKDPRLNPFWDELGRFLDEKAAVQERRQNNFLFMPFAMSFSDILEQIKARLPEGTPVPSLSWLKFNFYPSNPYTKVAACYTNRFQVKRTVQQRLLRAQHDDASFTAHQYTMMKQLAVKFRDNAAFVCVDDKATIPVGGPNGPLSTSVRPHNRGLVASTSQTLAALDHDFHVAGFIPSVLFKTGIPEDARDSFYSGEVHVTVKDKIFQPSSSMRHATENTDILRQMATDGITLNEPILFVYSDGGPDHRTNFLSVQLAAIAMFVALDLDMYIAVRTGPNQSYANPAERMMSLLNLALQNVALSREQMDPAYELKMKSLTNLKKLRLASAGDPTLKESLVNSLTPVLQVLKERFSRLKRKEEPVQVHEAATVEEIQDMAQMLYVIDDTIDCSALADVKVADHPRFKEFMERHCRCRHYSFQIRKCLDVDCFFCALNPPRLPPVELASMHYLPDPVLNDDGEYKDLTEVFGTETTDSDRPSLKSKPQPTENDKKFKNLFVAAKVRSFVTCCECQKRRIVYSAARISKKEEEAITRASEELYYVCGTTLFEEGAFAGKLVVKESINCTTPIETAYFAGVTSRNLKPICYHCGSQNILDVNANEELTTLSKEWSVVRPICLPCLQMGKKPATRNAFKVGRKRKQ